MTACSIRAGKGLPRPWADGWQIKVSRQELGRIAGCSREVAGRILKSLEEEGIVDVSGHTMVVLGTR